ncbi:MAG: hypothetical protein IPO08_23535 [Xanthomonadales bacterium]|nr:hypothetical protein [Xanthomonadales bacterium]
MAIGEVWTPGVDPDLAYTGESGESALSMQYYRNKAVEFQETLNRVDALAQKLNEIIELNANDPVIVDDALQTLAEYNSKKFLLKTTAEAINLGAAGINALGGRFPESEHSARARAGPGDSHRHGGRCGRCRYAHQLG